MRWIELRFMNPQFWSGERIFLGALSSWSVPIKFIVLQKLNEMNNSIFGISNFNLHLTNCKLNELQVSIQYVNFNNKILIITPEPFRIINERLIVKLVKSLIAQNSLFLVKIKLRLAVRNYSRTIRTNSFKY